MNARDRPKADASTRSRDGCPRTRGRKIRTSRMAEKATRKNTVPSGPRCAKRCLAMAALSCVETTASSAPDPTWVTDNGVLAVARSGNTIYLGGGFTEVGPRTGPAVAIDTTSGNGDLGMPQVSGGSGQVWVVASDGSGGWYLGGDFTHVAGQPRLDIAHVRSDKTLDPKFAPNPNGPVRALAVSGSTVYAGGDFTSIGGQARNHFAALGTSNGKATGWNPGADAGVFALVASGGTIYAGGRFT